MGKKAMHIQILVKVGESVWRVFEEGKYTRAELDERFGVVSSVFDNCVAMIVKSGRIIRKSGDITL